MISVKEALNHVTSGVSPLPSELVSIAEAHGRVLAEDIESRFTQPPAAVSSMDGYAVIAEDTNSCPVELTVSRPRVAATTEPLSAAKPCGFLLAPPCLREATPW